jgi:hypothetical protein
VHTRILANFTKATFVYDPAYEDSIRNVMSHTVDPETLPSPKFAISLFSTRHAMLDAQVTFFRNFDISTVRMFFDHRLTSLTESAIILNQRKLVFDDDQVRQISLFGQ